MTATTAATPHPVLPGAEPVDLRGGRIGVVLSHGFTGTTMSVRPWAEHLHQAGHTVLAPRLPGHGTSWRDMSRTTFADWYGEVERAFEELSARCDAVFAMGLSMGGTLALRLAEVHPTRVAGLVLVNASLGTARKDARLAPLLKHVVPAFPGVGSDIKKPGASELAYDKVSVRAFDSLRRAWPVVCADLHRITCPVLDIRSRVDHVVEPLSARLLREGTRSCEVEELVLENSWHVATLDNDAELLFRASAEFVDRHAPA